MKKILLLFAAFSIILNIQTDTFAEDTLFIYSAKREESSSSLSTYSRHLTKYIVGQGVSAQQQIYGDKILFQKLSDDQFLLMSTDLRIIDSNFNLIQILVSESDLKSNLIYEYYRSNMKLNKNNNFYTAFGRHLYEISTSSASVVRTIELETDQSVNIAGAFFETKNDIVVYAIKANSGSAIDVFYRKIGEDVSYKLSDEPFRYFNEGVFSYDEVSGQIIYALKNTIGSKQATIYLFNPITKEKSQIEINIEKEFGDATYGSHNDLIGVDEDATPINISRDRNLIYIGGYEVINKSINKRLRFSVFDGINNNVFLTSNELPAQESDCSQFGSFKTAFLKLYKQVLESINYAATNGCKRDGSTPLDTLTEIKTFSKKIKKSIPEQLDGFQAYEYLKTTRALGTTSTALNKCLKSKKAKPAKFKKSADKLVNILESAVSPLFKCEITNTQK